VAFSTPPEVQTFAALNQALAPLGYSISQKTRVLDCVRAAAENPKASTPVGSSLADWVIPGLRELASPFGPAHPWLEEGDWNYAFKAHFDFVVHEKLDSQHPTHPLFAVEFDGASTHADAQSRRRDLRKNRLCAASGLPLVRINDTFLHRREQLSVVEWLVGLWAAHRSEMPDLLAERDAEIEAMSQEELEAAGLWLLGERPDLDVDLVFRLEHPFPPLCRLAERLAAKYGFQWSEVNAIPPNPHQPRWRVVRWLPAVPSLTTGLVEHWRCELRLVGPGGRTAELQGLADVRKGYPLHEGEVEDSWDAFFAGRLPYLPAGPWTQASWVVGEALCLHNTLIEVEHLLRRESRRRAEHRRRENGPEGQIE
jgi:Protein of unknown function (DUF2726)